MDCIYQSIGFNSNIIDFLWIKPLFSENRILSCVCSSCTLNRKPEEKEEIINSLGQKAKLEWFFGVASSVNNSTTIMSYQVRIGAQGYMTSHFFKSHPLQTSKKYSNPTQIHKSHPNEPRLFKVWQRMYWFLKEPYDSEWEAEVSEGI